MKWELVLVSILASVSSAASSRRLEPGDRIEIICSQLPALCVARTVSSNGVVEVPTLGNIVASQQGWTQFARRIEALIRERKFEYVDVTVRGLQELNHPIGIEGLVKSTVSVPFVDGLTLQGLIGLIPFQENADRSVFTVTSVEGAAQVVDLSERNLRLVAGDRITVGGFHGANEAILVGGVQRPGAVSLGEPLSIAEALSRVGGFTPHADPSHLHLKRVDGTESDLQLSRDQYKLLKRGDVLTVKLLGDTGLVSIFGTIARPGIVEFKSGMTLTQVIDAAGGLKGGVNDRVTVRSIRDKGSRTRVFHLDRIFTRQDPDPVLQASDYIEVGSVRG